MCSTLQLSLSAVWRSGLFALAHSHMLQSNPLATLLQAAHPKNLHEAAFFARPSSSQGPGQLFPDLRAQDFKPFFDSTVCCLHRWHSCEVCLWQICLE